MLVIVVFAPLDAADAVRFALASGGAGQIGEYSACSFSTPGEGRFRPSSQANPTIGEKESDAVVEEVRIEAVCARERAADAIRAMLAAHPYEEPAYHCYEALTLKDLESSGL